MIAGSTYSCHQSSLHYSPNLSHVAEKTVIRVSNQVRDRLSIPDLGRIAVTARALTLGVTNDCKSMSVKLRYWIVNIIQRDTARPLVSRLCILKGSFT